MGRGCMIKKHGGNIYKFAEDNKINIENVIDFSANINPYGLPEGVKKVFDNMDVLLNYPDPDYKDLKGSIATFENLKSDQIIVGNGGIECLFLLAEHLAFKRILIPVPTFVEYERAFSKYGEVKFHYLDHSFELDIRAIKRDLDDVEAVMLCNPNNPTGHLIKKDHLLDLLDYTNKRSIYLIIDEAFIDFTDDEASNTLVDMIKDYDNLVILKSLTKFFAMPGLRLGYLMTSNESLLDDIQSSRMPWSVNTFAAMAGVEALKDQGFIKKTKDWIESERMWLYSQLQALGLEVFSSQGNYIFFKSIDNLDEKLARHGIMIRNCSNYEGLNEGYFRIAIKERSLNTRLIERLKEILWI